MKRSISLLFTALMFPVAIAPNAMAHTQNPHFPIVLSMRSPAMPEQPASDTTEPTSPKAEASPAPTPTMTPDSITNNTEKSRFNQGRLSIDNYPAYCSPLPPGTQPDDWEYRAALEKCLYGD